MQLNNLTLLLESIPKNVNIVAATKYVDALDMLKLLEYGIANFGENRVDVFLKKYEELKNKPIKWHFIGHLQTNKAKDVINKIDYLHSLDSLKLAKIIDENSLKPLNCFIEVNINDEENKNGVNYRYIDEFIQEVLKYKKVKIVGLMCMTKKDATSSEKYATFLKLKEILEAINAKFNLDLKELSMGMSDDYLEAIKAGATFIRLGRILWKQ